MATQYVQCRDREHAEQCAEAGILFLNMGLVGQGDQWVLHKDGMSDITQLYRNRDTLWPPSEFAYRLED